MPNKITKRARSQAARGGPRVLAGYLRLSEDRDGNKIGYDVQAEPIQQWADAYGYAVKWYKDKDLTAADKDIVRPEYERMLTDLKAGVVSGVIVWRMDRLVRLTREFERCFGIVEDAGGFIVDVAQEFTTKSVTGKLIMRLLVILAEMEIASMRARQLAHQRKKAEDGQYSGGGYRAFGFVGAQRNAKGEVTNKGAIGVKHVPREVKLLREAARRIAWEGEKYADVVRDWCTRNPPVLGTNGKPFLVGGLIDLLTSPRVAGYRSTETVDEETGKVTTTLHKAVWQPIIDEKTWGRLREMQRLRPDGHRSAATYLLSGGLGLCGKCGARLTAAPRLVYRPKGVPKTYESSYKCGGTVNAKLAGACGGTSIAAQPVERVVLGQLIIRLREHPELIDVVSAQDDDPAASAELAEALDEVAECDAELAAIATRRHLPRDHEDRLDEGEWSAMRKPLRQRRDDATKTVERLARVSSVPVPRGADRRDLLDWFDRLPTVSQKQEFLRAHVRAVVILPPVPGTRAFNPGRVRVDFADTEQSG